MKNEASSKGRDDVNNLKETTEESKNANRKDFSELQQESVTKNILLERLSLEEQNLGNYKFERDKPDLNAVLHLKEDMDSPIIRLDAVVDYGAQKLYEILKNTDFIQ